MLPCSLGNQARSKQRACAPAERQLAPSPEAVRLPCCPAGLYQRRVAAVRLLGELYNYKLVNSHVVFATLHLLLAYGHEAGTPPEVTRWVRGAGGNGGGSRACCQY